MRECVAQYIQCAVVDLHVHYRVNKCGCVNTNDDDDGAGDDDDDNV